MNTAKAINWLALGIVVMAVSLIVHLAGARPPWSTVVCALVGFAIGYMWPWQDSR